MVLHVGSRLYQKPQKCNYSCDRPTHSLRISNFLLPLMRDDVGDAEGVCGHVNIYLDRVHNVTAEQQTT